MSVAGDLERARHLTFADDHGAAKDLLLSLMPHIVELDRDDLALEVFAQLGEIYMVRGAHDGVTESVRRIRDCVSIYQQIRAGTLPDAAAQVILDDAVIDEMVVRYTRRADYLEVGLKTASGDHAGAAAGLSGLIRESDRAGAPTLAVELRELVARARIRCAIALSDDDDHRAAEPLWDAVLIVLDDRDQSVEAEHLWVLAGIGYGRFCVETGRLQEAEPHLQRAGARAERRGWQLALARTRLERAAAAWARSDHAETERLIAAAYPSIAAHAIAHDVSRCWLYLGLTRMATGGLAAADECWEHAERHWTELGKPLHVHRIILQRSWIDVFRGRFDQARDRVARARELLDSTPRSSWLQYARLDDLLGTIWRAEALSDLGFDGAGDPDADWHELEDRLAGSRGITTATEGSPGYVSAMAKFERAAELKLPAALAVDSVRHTIADADARWRWTTAVSAPLLAGAFAVAWEWENAGLVAQLVEYHSARGAFSTAGDLQVADQWTIAATAATPPADASVELVMTAAGSDSVLDTGRVLSLTRSGPLPPIRMDPTSGPILTHYRRLAEERYGRAVTSTEPVWMTWP